MSTKRNVAVVIGSLRKDSFNRWAAHALAAMAPAGIGLKIVEIAPLSMYNQDLDTASPAEWVKFREQIKASDAVLFITPEYNRSMPGALKNAIDIGSRPYGQSAWNGKPGAVMTISPGALGGFGANHHLRQSLVFLNVPTMQQPEAYVGGAVDMFDASGDIAKEATRKFFSTFLDAFAAWIEVHMSK